MNLYLLTQEENTGYDTYDSCIVAAETEAIAKEITPGYGGGFSGGCWASKAASVKVEKIGKAKAGTTRGVVLASFNAG